MAPPRKQEQENDSQNSTDITVSTSQRTDIRNFLENLSTDVSFEIMFLNDMIGYFSMNNNYPFDSPEDLDRFTKNWIGLPIPEDQMLTQIANLREKYIMRRLNNLRLDDDMEDIEYEALSLGRKIWNPGYMARNMGKNAKKDNQKRPSGSGAGHDQDHNT